MAPATTLLTTAAQEDNLCSVDGCLKRAKSKGLCGMHYERQRTRGTTQLNRRIYARRDPIMLFMSHVEIASDGCWNWTASVDHYGYGQFTLAGKKMGAHRAGWLLAIGPIEPSMQLDHLCRNRRCVNPDHLEPVTCRENLLRGDTLAARNHRKTECSHGHRFVDENIIWKSSGGNRKYRVCKECARLDSARRRANSRLSK